jgi:two-component system OmpR family response regulator
MKSPQGQWPMALAGALEHVGLSSLLNLLEMERRSGVLDLRTRGRGGRLAFRDGAVVAASLDGADQPGCDVVCEVLTWKQGRFVFRVGPVEAPDEATLPASVLLLEAARRADEIAAA